MKNKKNDNHKSESEIDYKKRAFLKGSGATALLGSVKALAGPIPGAFARKDSDVYDYVIVGAGPGGGPLATRLAEAGYSVAVIEAGADPAGEDVDAIDPSIKTVYETPGLFTVASEHPILSWDFFVNHYENEEQQQKDSKYVKGKGILYPRGSCLGGSMSHNALIFVYPHDSDFEFIADVTRDPSWQSHRMRDYFVRLEDCGYCEPGAPGHGFDGYIQTSMIEQPAYDLFPAINDLAFAGSVTPESYVLGNVKMDINDPLVARGDVGTFKTPMHEANYKRVTVRDHLVQTQQKFPGRLKIFTGSLATKVLTVDKFAVGVEFRDGGGYSYAASKLHKGARRGTERTVYASREVILSGGAFNTPQLLMNSGIGPASDLESHGIEVVADVPGVGKNLQDRYEVSVGVDLKDNFDLFSRCRPFQVGDPCLESYLSGEWEDKDEEPAEFHGPYASNVIFATRIAKSTVADGDPDLFLIGLPVPFSGYYPGYSSNIADNRWTWLVLKAHTENNAGTVTLRSNDPTDTPVINFRYFEEGSDRESRDLDAVVEGVRLVRSYLNEPEAKKHILKEVIPGDGVTSRQELEDFVRNEAWGHHASCTCKIGDHKDPMAVLDSEFRVRGVEHLRVVDASAFPKIPGFFPVTAILMISEKASDAILKDADKVLNQKNKLSRSFKGRSFFA